MIKRLLITLTPLLVLFTQASHSHSFSTSFVSLQKDNVLNYQLSLHDFAALNQQWLQGKPIKRSTFSANRDNITAFVRQVITLKEPAARCQVALVENDTFATINIARQDYVVIKLQTNCGLPQLSSITINDVWQEFPDHKVIIESALAEHATDPVVLTAAATSHSYQQ